MFKKFTEDNVTGTQQLKTSVQRSIRQRLIEQYPFVEEHLEVIWPKKENLKMVKCQDHLELYANANTNQVLFFKTRDGPIMPTLRLLHQYPFLLNPMQVDKGAIKFILRGADVMAPGLTSKGGRLSNVAAGTPVCIIAEGHQCALGVGVMKLSTAEIEKKSAGVAITLLHYIGDGLWLMPTVR